MVCQSRRSRDGSAIWMYDVTGGARIGKLHRRVDAENRSPTAGDSRENLASGYVYYDAAVDDARLMLDVARTAAALVPLSPTAAGSRSSIARARSRHRCRVDTGDGEVRVAAAVVVSAAGVWAAEIRRSRTARNPTIRPAKGVHVTFPWALFGNDIAAMIPVPGDKRSLFIVPWGRRPEACSPTAMSARRTPTTTDELDDPQTTTTTSATCSAPSTPPQAHRSPLRRRHGRVGRVAAARQVGLGARTADLSRRHSMTDRRPVSSRSPAGS